ncbi:MAG: hypothetical protein HY731_04655, partial [Candidatus Tectomicrobia bacterium]|nr:hypothetical protein [Candidatus Tectomicrobia bacterium]
DRRPKRVVESAVVGGTVAKSTTPKATAKTKSITGSRTNRRRMSVKGCTEALHLCLRAVTKAGDMIAVESPTYYGILRIIESLKVRAYDMISKGIKIVIFCF